MIRQLTTRSDTYFHDLVRKRLIAERSETVKPLMETGVPQCPQCRREFADWSAAQAHWKECTAIFLRVSLEARLESVLREKLPPKRRKVDPETARVIKVEAFRLLLERERELLEKQEARTDLDKIEKQRRLSEVKRYGTSKGCMAERFLFFGEENKRKRYEKYRVAVSHHRTRVEEFFRTLKPDVVLRPQFTLPPRSDKP